MASFELKVIANCDDVHLVWRPQGAIPNCLGFALYRKRNGGSPELLKNRVGFSANQGNDSEPQPSTTWPFQRLDWTDHGANTGDKVSYQVVAMIGGQTPLQPGPSSQWSPEVTLTPDCGDGMSAFFNRGVVLSQFVGRIMRERNWTAADLKKHAGMLHDSLREFLAGDLRKALLDLLDEAARDSKVQVYAALFELSDEDLGKKLEFLGPRLHIVLGNGAIKQKGADENKAMRARLKKAGAEVFNRMTAPTFLAHNKFVVLCRGTQAYKVWTGSTNWQPTGLCTQVNNGILIANSALANDFLVTWERLKDEGDGHSKAFKTTNSKAPIARSLGQGVSAFARFTATADQIDMSELLKLINKADNNIFFEMFMPGTDIFDAVVGKSQSLFVRGVANTFPKPGKTKGPVDVSLVDGAGHRPFSLDVVEPEGIDHAFAYWAEEVTRKKFAAIGHAIVHSKVLVLDAWTDHQVVVIGSHNFSITASKSNDENYVVITGSQTLAQAYAVNCLTVYDHYRWRKYVADCAAAHKQPWSHLSTALNWLTAYQQAPERQAMLKFWFQ